MKLTYIIKYALKIKDGTIIKSGTIKVKNKRDKLDAKISLDIHLSKRFTYDKMVVYSCIAESPGSFLNNIFK